MLMVTVSPTVLPAEYHVTVVGNAKLAIGMSTNLVVPW